METKIKGLLNRLDKFGNTPCYVFFRASRTGPADMALARPINFHIKLNYCIRSIRRHSYYLFCAAFIRSFIHQFCAASIQEWQLFKSGIYFTQPIPLAFADIEESEVYSIEWLLDRQENLLVVADWFTSLSWVRFVSSCVCARATQVFVMPTAATTREQRLFLQHVWRCGYCSKVATNRERCRIEQIQYV